MADEARWYVVHTYSGMKTRWPPNLKKTVENRQLQDLMTGNPRAYGESVGSWHRWKAQGSGAQNIFRLCHRKDDYDGRILVCGSEYPGLHGIVGPSSKPVPLTDDEVARLGIEKHEIEVSYKVGDSVNIVDGPWRVSSEQWKNWMWRKNRIRVVVSMFGRDTPVERN